MKKYYIENFGEFVGREITDYFAVSEKSLRKTRADKPYLRITCLDKTGQVVGNIWDNAPNLSKKFTIADIVKLQASVELYENQIQLRITNIRKAREEEYEIADFSPTITKDVDKLTEHLFKFIDSIQNQYLNELLHLFFDDKEFLKKFVSAPAAKSWHHNKVGGLLHHTITVAKICNAVENFYDDIDRDLLVCCAILHDIGKIDEYYLKPFIDFTDEGKLVGHIVLGDKMVVDKCEQIDNFPKMLLNKIRHLLLSHHGEREKGAVCLPKTREAILLHYADNMDAHLIGVQDLIDKAKEQKRDWTEYNNLTKRE
nr:HD domain-containing protein [Candidatus Cloacimonadota bacterium]